MLIATRAAIRSATASDPLAESHELMPRAEGRSRAEGPQQNALGFLSLIYR